MPDIENTGSPEEDTNFNMSDDSTSLADKFSNQIERQSITNSKVFDMSDTDFIKFDINQEITEYIEVSNEEEFAHSKDDLE